MKKNEIRMDSEDDVFHEPLKSKLKTPGRIGRRHTGLLRKIKLNHRLFYLISFESYHRLA